MTVAEITAPEDVLVARIVARGRETAQQARERVQRKVPDYPPGVRVDRIVNDGALADAVATFCTLLRDVRRAGQRPERTPAADEGVLPLHVP